MLVSCWRRHTHPLDLGSGAGSEVGYIPDDPFSEFQFFLFADTIVLDSLSHCSHITVGTPDTSRAIDTDYGMPSYRHRRMGVYTDYYDSPLVDDFCRHLHGKYINPGLGPSGLCGCDLGLWSSYHSCILAC